MPSTTAYSFGDVVLVPFPSPTKPAARNDQPSWSARRPTTKSAGDLVIMAVTSQVRRAPAFGEFLIAEWNSAGLLLPSVAKPVLATIEKRLVLKRLGKLQTADGKSLETCLRTILG